MSLDEMQARCDAATPGPWKLRAEHYDDWGTIRSGDGMPVASAAMEAVIGDWREHASTHGNSKQWDAGPPQVAKNGAFIAHARTDMPRLIAALRVAMEGLEPFEDDCGGSTIEDDWRHLDGLRTHAIAALARVAAILEGK